MIAKNLESEIGHRIIQWNQIKSYHSQIKSSKLLLLKREEVDIKDVIIGDLKAELEVMLKVH